MAIHWPFSHFEIGNSAWIRIILIQLLISRKIALADDDMQILDDLPAPSVAKSRSFLIPMVRSKRDVLTGR